jgi:hypothetical protein
MNRFEKLLPWLALGGAAFVAWRILNAGTVVKDALANVGSAIGTGLYDYLHPGEFGDSTFHIVLFPDGQKHAVPASKVASDGTFMNFALSTLYRGDGKRYQLLVKKSDRAQWVAVPV